ncbi:MAG TPA: biopolymer transporter ExbD [Candidatus Kapabacteria bacterium]|nr:biopolymer transporter ExbD [Candidatus Kapabacteria bacterium]
MAEIVQGGGRKHKGKRRVRLGVRLDMTPMVDVAFLLLTFFMLTTTLLTPQVMEIVMPPDSKIPVEIAESNLLTLRIRADQAVFWNMGTEAPQKIAEADVPKILKEHLQINPKLSTLIKIDRAAKYQTLVTMVDDLNTTQAALNQTEKRFSLVAMDDTDMVLVKNL